MTTNKNYQALVIHLKRARQRKPQVSQIIRDAPLDAVIIDAVDGATLSQAEINAVYTTQALHQPKYPFKLNAGEIGCFLSHRKAWQYIIDQQLSAALIFEDDLTIDRALFLPAFHFAKEMIQQYGYIQFPVKKVPQKSKQLVSKDNMQLLQPSPPRLRTSAQFVSMEAARILLQKSETFDRPVDTFIQTHWSTQINPVCIVPSGITDQTQECGGSTLARQRKLGEKIPREWQRFFYRLNVKHLSRKSQR